MRSGPPDAAPPEPTRLGVVGTGLIGTSVAMAAARAGLAVRAYDVDPVVLGRAGAQAGFEPAASVEDCAAGADVVLVCTPLPAIAETVVRALAASPTAVVTDAGSVKGSVVREVERLAGAAAARFVGGHPMGGSERSGPDHASASVVDGIVWVLTPTARTDPAARARVRRLVERLGSQPVEMEAARHDRLVAFVSHLPQVASTALMGLAAAEEADEPQILLLAAGGFRDLTRLAASNPALWSSILLANREALAEAIDLYRDRLRLLRDLVVEGRGAEVERAFADAKRARLALSAKPQVRAGVAVLQVPVPDRPGVLAELTATLGEAGVNIEDLQIVHSPEGGRGTVHLTVGASAAEGAQAALEARGFDPVRLA
ncbi:MAG TPA: prephenate dehydrogenase/arogenate dehydrogenase family protein [Actinomycetota bacterium]|nr:prephenate dehydrogenase/arogenate dehydrogenase family protein [Actinomycetota bacterium]